MKKQLNSLLWLGVIFDICIMIITGVYAYVFFIENEFVGFGIYSLILGIEALAAIGWVSLFKKST